MFKKIEFSAITAFFGLIVYRMIENAAWMVKQGQRNASDEQFFANRGVPYHFPQDYYHYFLYPNLVNAVVIYISFLLFNYLVAPCFFQKSRRLTAVIGTLSLLAIMWTTFTITAHNQYIIDYRMGFNMSNWCIFVLGLFILYTAIKRLVMFYLNKQDKLEHVIVQKTLLATLIWLAVLFFLAKSRFGNISYFDRYWITIIPALFFVFMINYYWLLPEYDHKQQLRSTYISRLTLVSFLVCLPFGMGLTMNTHSNPLFIFAFWLLVLAVVVPLSHYLYQRNKEQLTQLLNLKTELTHTSANLDFLRSQINPHFLFNALNTLYGTALQEDSERTANGIQKLADMMRQMLHENRQDTILLNREVEYLLNYIHLQSLRIQTSPNITIDTNIEQEHNGYQIAPMLLIPFIENAFKHGISMANKSWINISLGRKDNVLTLMVNNSIHKRNPAMRKEEHSGIGLDNVKQRLNLIYPQKHQLVTEHTETEYKVNLIIFL